MESLRIIFGKRLRSLREQHGWSQEQLGRAAGLGGKYIGTIERAEKSASFEAIEKLSKALKVDSYQFFVPLNRRSDSVSQQVKALVSEKGRIDVDNVEEFLRTLGIALRKLDRSKTE
jgi:XRE family transcriptional regulator, regulator of sulfur utilization